MSYGEQLEGIAKSLGANPKDKLYSTLLQAIADNISGGGGAKEYTEITSPLENGAEYRLTNVSDLTITYPSGNFECWLRITTGAGTVTITLPTSDYIGAVPTFESSTTYEMSIKDGVVAFAEVTDGD